jgi:hypothetical protein
LTIKAAEVAGTIEKIPGVVDVDRSSCPADESVLQARYRYRHR